MFNSSFITKLKFMVHTAIPSQLSGSILSADVNSEDICLSGIITKAESNHCYSDCDIRAKQLIIAEFIIASKVMSTDVIINIRIKYKLQYSD